MGKLRVSIVIPVHNEQDMIGPCLDAVAEQTVAADEVVVVDNNSTDATRERLRKYGERVTVLHEPRQGVCPARNTGFDAATGDVIGRIDADTRLPPHWIERLHRVFADDEVQAATGPARYYDILLPGVVAWIDLTLRTLWARAGRQRLDWLLGANMAIRADAWRAVRGGLCADRSIHEDVDLGIHLYAADRRVVFSPELLAGTSARRVRDSPRTFWTYLKMTERAYTAHPGLTSEHAHRRAWLTDRFILALYPSLRVLHRACRPDGTGASLKSLRTRPQARKNPMADA